MLVASERTGNSLGRLRFDSSFASVDFFLNGAPLALSSWNFCTVVRMVLPEGVASSDRRSRTLFARSGLGKPHAPKVLVI
jgi:hypothetical protein